MGVCAVKGTFPNDTENEKLTTKTQVEPEKTENQGTDITKTAFQTPEDLFAYDPKLKGVDKNWGKAAPLDSIAKTKKALEEKKYKVDVVEKGEDALKLLKSLDVKDSSIYVAGSTTLSQIGFTTFLQENKDWAKRNIKAESVAAQQAGDMNKAGQLMKEGQVADVFFSSVASLAETGEIHVVCASGTRTGGFLTAGKLVIVVGSNKIAKDLESALQRTREYALPLESARARIAYASWGVTESSINYETILRGGNPFGAPRLHVIIVKEPIGF